MSEEGKGTAVGFSGGQQAQPVTDVPQSMPPLVTQANPQPLPGIYNNLSVRIIDCRIISSLLNLIFFI